MVAQPCEKHDLHQIRHTQKFENNLRLHAGAKGTLNDLADASTWEQVLDAKYLVHKY